MGMSKQRGMDLLQRGYKSLSAEPPGVLLCCLWEVSKPQMSLEQQRCWAYPGGGCWYQSCSCPMVTIPGHAPAQSVVKTKSNPAGTSTLLMSALHQPRCQPHSVSSHCPTLRSFWESIGLLLLRDTQVASAQPCLREQTCPCSSITVIQKE